MSFVIFRAPSSRTGSLLNFFKSLVDARMRLGHNVLIVLIPPKCLALLQNKVLRKTPVISELCEQQVLVNKKSYLALVYFLDDGPWNTVVQKLLAQVRVEFDAEYRRTCTRGLPQYCIIFKYSKERGDLGTEFEGLRTVWMRDSVPFFDEKALAEVLEAHKDEIDDLLTSEEDPAKLSAKDFHDFS